MNSYQLPCCQLRTHQLTFSRHKTTVNCATDKSRFPGDVLRPRRHCGHVPLFFPVSLTAVSRDKSGGNTFLETATDPLHFRLTPERTSCFGHFTNSWWQPEILNLLKLKTDGEVNSVGNPNHAGVANEISSPLTPQGVS